MTGYYTPDISGINPAYASADTITYFQNPQVLEFPVPVFLSSIVIQQVGTTDAWKLDSDFVVAETSDTAGAVARNQDKTFSAALVKKITLQKALPADTQYQIAVAYQGFYPPGGTLAFDQTENAWDWSPDVLADLYRRVLVAQQSTQKVSSTSILPSGTPKVLEYDPNETNPDNLIENEEYSFNTLQGQTTIRPLNAPFFKDSVVLALSDGTVLTKDVDYVCRGFDPTRTEISTNDSGVYNLITLNTKYAGTALLTYHAVGGTVQVSDFSGLQIGLEDIVTFLNSTSFLTTDMLSSTLPFVNLVSRQAKLEAEMRALLSGNPSYGATTSGTVVVRTLQTTDANMHWWNVASLYQIPGSTSIITADTMILRVEMPDRNLQANVTISADVLADTTPLVITAQNVLYDQGYTPATNTAPTSVPIPVQFRLIWNSATDYTSGAILQIGTCVPNLTERLSLLDMTNQDGTWQLTTAGTGNATPDDAGPFNLPNSSASWSYPANSSSSNKAVAYPIPMEYLVYAGSIDSAAILAATSGYSVPNANPNLDVTLARTARVYYTTVSGGTSTMRVCSFPMVNSGSATLGTSEGVYNGANSDMYLTVQGSSSGLTLSVNQASTGGPTLAINAIFLDY